MGSRKDAIQQFEKLCRLLPDLEWPYYYLGELWIREGNKQMAAEAFQQALDVRGDFMQARDALNELDM